MIGKPGKSAALFEKRMHFSVSEFLIDPVKGGSGIYEIKRVFLRVKILKTAVYACEMRVGRKLLVADVRKMRPAFNGCDFAAAFVSNVHSSPLMTGIMYLLFRGGSYS